VFKVKQEITPIFIIGAARNGTTNLENTIASFPQVAGVEHWLHYGSHESNLYMNKKYWGEFTDAYSYIRFLYQYSSSDYFKLCGGEIEYHLNHKRINFYEFFFELMDHYAGQNDKTFWITKLDPNFSFDDDENRLFFRVLEERYPKVKFIRIKRNFEDAFKSYVNMEGKSHSMRQRSALLLPGLILQASRYVLTYGKITKYFDSDILEIDFHEYINNRENQIEHIANYLEIPIKELTHLDLDRFKVNTSFVNKSRKEMPGYISFLLPLIIQLYHKFPSLAKTIWKSYFRFKGKTNPIYHRILCHKYFEAELLKELSFNNATGLLEKLENEAPD
jgi:hypothetical protein